MNPKVLHVGTYDTNGGAARAAHALNVSMQKRGVQSSLMAAHGLKFRLSSELDRRLWPLQTSNTNTWRSPAFFGSMGARQINRSDADIVNLHWVTDGYLSIKEIGKITKPLVWSLYDMWPFCGTEHYGVDSPDARWRNGYTRSNRPKSEGGFDLDRWTWERKKSHWRPMNMVAASSWMHQSLSASDLMSDWPSVQIPHPIDCEVFAPMDRDAARAKLELPIGVPLIVFLASAGVTDSRKGFDLLDESLKKVRVVYPDVQIVVAGPQDVSYAAKSGTPIIWVGNIDSNQTLRELYASASVVATPSREDNMPLTAMEAQSCGRAVVAFDLGGLPDIVSHGKTGYLATPLDVESLGVGLVTAINDAVASNSLGNAARQRALETWSSEAVVNKYLALYTRVI
jgi:glycosyltransferase involved in cell wall biosynthesis